MINIKALYESMKEPATKTDIIITFSVFCFLSAILIVVTA